MTDYDEENDEFSTRTTNTPLRYQSLCRSCHSRGPETGKVCNSCRWEWTEPGDSSSADTARYRNDWNTKAYDREWWQTLLSSLVEVDEDYDGPVVYIVGSVEEKGRVKIGFTTNPHQRLQNLQSSSPHKLGFIRLFQGDRDLEKDFHRYLHASRSHGEWFDVHGEVSELMP